MSTNIRQLAEAAGVSIATVSRVLNNSDHPVSEKTRHRIWTLAETLNYHPNHIARSLRTEQTSTIGILTDDITSSFSPQIVRAIQDELKGYGYSTLIVNADRQPDVESEAIRHLLARSVDGIIFVETWHHEANRLLTQAGKPYVFAHRLFASNNQYTVRPDEYAGAQIAVHHLLGLGHRRIGYINGPTTYFMSDERLHGYEDALAAAGIESNPQWIERGDWFLPSGYEAAKAILAHSPRPTAIFAANDLMAVGALYAIQDAGLRVPEDIAVVGYDNQSIAGMVRPALTSVTLPCYEMGQTSAQMLVDLLQNPMQSIEEVKICGKLVVRQSCGSGVERAASV